MSVLASVELTITLELGTRWSEEEKVEEVIRQAGRDARDAVLRYTENGRQPSPSGVKLVRVRTGKIRIMLEEARR